MWNRGKKLHATHTMEYYIASCRDNDASMIILRKSAGQRKTSIRSHIQVEFNINRNEITSETHRHKYQANSYQRKKVQWKDLLEASE